MTDVVGIQLDIAWEDPPANHGRVEELLEGADVAEGSLVVLPEMFATGFSMDVAAVAEPAGGATETFLSSIAARYGSWVIGGVVTQGAGGKGRNEAVAFGADGGEVARYRKRHPFSFADETDYYEPGDDIVRFECSGFTVSPFICYDLRFPECFRASVTRGTDVFVVIANWPAAREAHWPALLRARAIENQSYVVGINRCGSDPKHSYSGRSLVLDPIGEVLADAGNEEGLVRAGLEGAFLAKCRSDFPVLADMRMD